MRYWQYPWKLDLRSSYRRLQLSQPMWLYCTIIQSEMEVETKKLALSILITFLYPVSCTIFEPRVAFND